MTTATPIDRGLYAVPAPPQQERFAILLRLRRAARVAFDTLLALPKGAAGWVLRQTRTVMAALGSNPTLTRLGAGLSNVGRLIRSVGPIPAAAAVLSIPAVWRATVRAARWLGDTIAAGANSLWQHTRSLLLKLGPTGTRITAGLTTVGGMVRRVLTGFTGHPVTATIVRGAASVGGLVRPISHSVVLHRLLGALVGSSWLRWALELLMLPLVLAPTLVADLRTGVRGASAPSGTATSRPAQSGRAATFGDEPASLVVDDADTAEPTRSGDWVTTLEPRNRAERRAAQQAQAHAKRAHARH